MSAILSVVLLAVAEPVALIPDAASQGAWTATVSYPLPRAEAEALYADGQPAYSVGGVAATAYPVGWWKRGTVPRRVMLYAAGDGPLGNGLMVGVSSGGGPGGTSPWTVTDRPFAKHQGTAYKVILRGGSHADSYSEFNDLVLGYQGRELVLRMGTRRAKFHGSLAFQDTFDWWQWTRIEPLLDTPQVKLVRVGALLYNEDSFLHCDLYLELFGNGVGRAYAHFIDSRVIGDGWEYFGIPVLALKAGEGAPVEAVLDGTATAFDVGGAMLDIRDSADLVSPEHPGRLYGHDGFTIYQPWQDQRVTDQAESYGAPFVTRIGDGTMLRGLARTVRFNFSLAEAPPAVGRLLAPSWRYAMAEDLWQGGYLPAQWRFAHTSHALADTFAQPDPRYHGTFEGGYSGRASVGNGGTALLFSAHHSGDPEHLTRGLAYAYAWADIMVDHVDWSIRQPFTGYYWKTPPYTLYNDLVVAYLETGDPYLLETAEHCANAYYALIRSTWPARSMGRGTMPTLGQLLLAVYRDEPYYAQCALDIVRKALFTFDDPERLPGHAIGVGPNGIGNWNAPQGRGYADLVMLESVVEAAIWPHGLLDAPGRRALLEDGAEVLRLALDGIKTKPDDDGWREFETALMMLVMLPMAKALDRPALAEELERWIADVEDWLKQSQAGRPYDSVKGRPYYDAATLQARWVDGAVEIDPKWLPAAAHGQTARIETPAGRLSVHMQREADGTWRFEPVEPAPCAVRVVQ